MDYIIFLLDVQSNLNCYISQANLGNTKVGKDLKLVT
jgi:hypothetical protein